MLRAPAPVPVSAAAQGPDGQAVGHRPGQAGTPQADARADVQLGHAVPGRKHRRARGA